MLKISSLEFLSFAAARAMPAPPQREAGNDAALPHAIEDTDR
jgi:hypothetical protein